MTSINSISGGKTSCMMSLEFPADVNLFALVENQGAIGSPATRFPPKAVCDANDWVRQHRPGFWATTEDDNSLVCLHETAKLLAQREPWAYQINPLEAALTVTWAGQFNHKWVDFETLITDRNYLPNARKRLCTQYLKVEPIFQWCQWQCPGEVVSMRIGFRTDEVERTINLYYRQTKVKGRLPNPGYDLTAAFARWRLPAYLARWWEVMGVEDMVRRGVLIEKASPFNTVNGVDFRTPEFPLIEAGITPGEVVKYWKGRSKFPFPAISNCVGCFHHSISQLQQQWLDPVNKHKMEWMARQEDQKGHLFGKNYSYRQIRELPVQQQIDFLEWTSCDSGGCTD